MHTQHELYQEINAKDSWHNMAKYTNLRAVSLWSLTPSCELVEIHFEESSQHAHEKARGCLRHFLERCLPRRWRCHPSYHRSDLLFTHNRYAIAFGADPAQQKQTKLPSCWGWSNDKKNEKLILQLRSNGILLTFTWLSCCYLHIQRPLKPTKM